MTTDAPIRLTLPSTVAYITPFSGGSGHIVRALATLDSLRGRERRLIIADHDREHVVHTVQRFLPLGGVNLLMFPHQHILSVFTGLRLPPGLSGASLILVDTSWRLAAAVRRAHPEARVVLLLRTLRADYWEGFTPAALDGVEVVRVEPCAPYPDPERSPAVFWALRLWPSPWSVPPAVQALVNAENIVVVGGFTPSNVSFLRERIVHDGAICQAPDLPLSWWLPWVAGRHPVYLTSGYGTFWEAVRLGKAQDVSWIVRPCLMDDQAVRLQCLAANPPICPTVLPLETVLPWL